MIEAFLVALNLTDDDIYNKVQIYDMVNEQVVESENTYDIAIIGPTLFDVRKQSNCPVFSMWKVNNIDNRYFSPPKKAYLIVTQIETGKNTIIQASINDGKLPNPKQSSGPVYPPDYDRNKKIIRYGKIWTDITQKDLSWIDGKYTIQMICGKMISNTIDVLVVGSSGKVENATPQNENQQVPLLDSIQKSCFEKSNFSPKIPEKPNVIEIVVTDGVETNLNNYIVFGSFNVSAIGTEKKYSLDISLIVQYSSENGFIHEIISVPVNLTITQDGSLFGYFNYDLKKMFFNKFTKKLNIPELILVNVMYGTVMSNMVEVKNELH